MMVRFPVALGDVTPAWLTDVLRARHLARRSGSRDSIKSSRCFAAR